MKGYPIVLICKQSRPITFGPDLRHSAVYRDFLYYLFFIKYNVNPPHNVCYLVGTDHASINFSHQGFCVNEALAHRDMITCILSLSRLVNNGLCHQCYQVERKGLSLNNNAQQRLGQVHLLPF